MEILQSNYVMFNILFDMIESFNWEKSIVKESINWNKDVFPRLSTDEYLTNPKGLSMVLNLLCLIAHQIPIQNSHVKVYDVFKGFKVLCSYTD